MATPRRKTKKEQEIDALFDSIYQLHVPGKPQALFESRIEKIVSDHTVFQHDDQEIKNIPSDKKLEVGSGSFHANTYNQEMRSLLQPPKSTSVAVTKTKERAKNTARQYYLGNTVFELYQLVKEVVSREEKKNSAEYKNALNQAKQKAETIIEDRHHRRAAFMRQYERDLKTPSVMDPEEQKRIATTNRLVTYYEKDEKTKVETRIQVTEAEQIKRDAELAQELDFEINHQTMQKLAPSDDERIARELERSFRRR